MEDIQLFQSVNNVGFNANGGKATSKGLEAQATWRPIRGLQFLANAAITDAQLDEDAPDAGGFKGDWLPWVPRTSFSLNADYDWMLSSDLHAFVGAGWHFVGKQSADFDAAYRTRVGQQRRIDSYGVADLRVGVDFHQFTLEAYVQNITNSRGLTSATLLTTAAFGTPALPKAPLAPRSSDRGRLVLPSLPISARKSGKAQVLARQVEAEADRLSLALPQPYLLFLGDTVEPGYAKTAFGLRDWAPEKCVGEFALPSATVTAGLPKLTPEEGTHVVRARL